MNIYCITWKDERWSANKEDLKEINKMINKGQVRKKSLLSLINPQAILLFFMYVLGFAYHGFTSLLKWLILKLKRNK